MTIPFHGTIFQKPHLAFDRSGDSLISGRRRRDVVRIWQADKKR
jgi:hypothetical protein